ncbi:transglycosylase SLT domain-containing protein [Photobacterium indicum]|uniref:Murein transglycosylase n=1 Tax=Photobacterium indicum TaxID=81447 RepID=A0A2T3LA82_9GAMM|nr:transglycosylase SLT domain-containing protein [Photobacterium indicum]PSV48233.1 murein transglycosylase [Photobacterium indicum]
MFNSIVKSTLAVAIASALSFNIAIADDKFAELDQAVTKQKQSHVDKVVEFHSYINAYLDEYESWRDQYTKDLDAQRAKLIASWGEGEVSGKTKTVDYSEDGQVKTVVDYDTNTMSVSLLVDVNYNPRDMKQLAKKVPSSIDGQKFELEKLEFEEELNLYSPEKEKKETQFIITQTQQQMNELDIQAERLIRSDTGVPDSYIYERAYKKNMALIMQSKKRIDVQSKIYKEMRAKYGIPEEVIIAKESSPIESTPVNTVPIKVEKKKTGTLISAPTQKDDPKVQPQKKTETATAPVIAKKAPAVVSTPKVTTPKKVVKYNVKLPANSLKIRATQYQPLAEKESQTWKIDAALVMAIMHSESAFRPDAKSHVPAFGLMQVVPSSAGHDVNKQVRNIDAPMKAADLYKPEINVETGTAYLHILHDRYLKSIKSNESRLYCVIAAYNTGAGNVARAFNTNKSTSVGRAAKVINLMSPDEVYDHLIKNLPYDETKNYLKKVNGRIALYR